MADPLEKIPPEVRWQIATKGLTGAIMAFSNALRQAVGEEKHNEFNRAFWYQAGKGVKEFVEAFGLPVSDAKQIEEAIELTIRASMGPEFNFDVVEATPDRCVVRTSKCAWYERCKEQGIVFDLCSDGHPRWGKGAVESLNPDFTHSIPKAMPRGDLYCEVVIERKK